MQVKETQSGGTNAIDETPSCAPKGGYVDGPRLLETLFPNEQCRPSLRWLRDQQKRRAIPFVKISHLVFFDPKEVRDALADRHTIRPHVPAARLRTLSR